MAKFFKNLVLLQTIHDGVSDHEIYQHAQTGTVIIVHVWGSKVSLTARRIWPGMPEPTIQQITREISERFLEGNKAERQYVINGYIHRVLIEMIGTN